MNRLSVTPIMNKQLSEILSHDHEVDIPIRPNPNAMSFIRSRNWWCLVIIARRRHGLERDQRCSGRTPCCCQRRATDAGNIKSDQKRDWRWGKVRERKAGNVRLRYLVTSIPAHRSLPLASIEPRSYIKRTLRLLRRDLKELKLILDDYSTLAAQV